MNARTVLYGLLSVVAAAAAVLSFAALRDLARLCGFTPWLAWLLPVVVDAGAAAGSLVWLGGDVGRAARRFARALALALLGLSVAANALGHGLAAFGLAPAWWVVVIVSAIAPAVLGAVVHLAVLVGRPSTETESEWPVPTADSLRLASGGLEPVPVGSRPDRAVELIAAGAGRRRLSRELEITEHEARRLLARTRDGPDGMDSVDTTPSTASNRIRDGFPDGGAGEDEQDRRPGIGHGEDAAGRVAVLHTSSGRGGAR